MTTTTPNDKRSNATAEPLDMQMWSREGFDRHGIRHELAGGRLLSIEDKYIQQDDETYPDPRSIDMPVGPTAMGEVEGQGMRMIEIEGDRWPTFRWTQGFEVLQEDSDDVEEQRNAVLELFDFFADVAFLTGIGPDQKYQQGCFDWLRGAIPEERTFDCAEYTDDSSVKNRPENLLKKYALERIDGRLMDMEDASWDMMVGSQRALANFNQITDIEGVGVLGKTYFDRLSSEDSISGVDDWMLMPDFTSPAKVPYTDGEDSEEMMERFKVDLVDKDVSYKEKTTEDGVIGDDEIFIFPDMDGVKENYWRLHEMGEPELHGPMLIRGGKWAYDYSYRYVHRFNPVRRHPEATDCLHLKNVSELFN